MRDIIEKICVSLKDEEYNWQRLGRRRWSLWVGGRLYIVLYLNKFFARVKVRSHCEFLEEFERRELLKRFLEREKICTLKKKAQALKDFENAIDQLA